jgi:type I restriction-modification system DNA methylase subunit
LDDNIQAGNSLVDDPHIAGKLAFSWSNKFKEIMRNGGFDIVVGNPPYADSGAIAKFWSKEREWITGHFSYTRGNWDLYVAFLELGYRLLAPGGYLSFITPDKWISKPLGSEIRKHFTPGLVSILPVGREFSKVH